MKPLLTIAFLVVATTALQAQHHALNELTRHFETLRGVYPYHWVCTGDTIKCDTNDDGVVGYKVSGLWVSSCETPRDLWCYIMDLPLDNEEEAELPVTAVRRIDVDTFIARLNRMTRQQWRLPTREEWLFVYHGGIFSEGYRYCGSNRPEWVAWYRGTSGGRLHPVGERIPNEVDMYDMLGNAAEWVTVGDSIQAIGGCCLDPSPKNNPDHMFTPAPPSMQGFRLVFTEAQWFW